MSESVFTLSEAIVSVRKPIEIFFSRWWKIVGFEEGKYQ